MWYTNSNPLNKVLLQTQDDISTDNLQYVTANSVSYYEL